MYYIHDFGRDAFGTLDVELTGNGGEQVELAIGEVLLNGRLNRNPGGYRCFKKMDLTLKKGTHTYSFVIPVHAAPDPSKPKCYPPDSAKGEIAPFRYAEVCNYTGPVNMIRHEIYAPFNDAASHFECSDEQLNKIWDFCKYSIKATTAFGKYIDGERERLPYEGDTYINQLGHFCCDTNFEIARNTVEHFLKYPTWPAEWRLLIPVIVRDYLLYSGDKESVKRWIPEIDQFLLLNLAGDDLLIRGTEEIRDIVDWPLTERDNYEFGDVNFVPNCYHYGSLLAMYELTQNPVYLSRAGEVKKSLRKHFLTPDNLFRDNPASSHTAIHSAMFAIRFGIAEKTEYPALERIIRERGMACSVFGAQFLLEACYHAGFADHALALMKRKDLRSWQNMMDKGATITMEAWDDSCKPNQDWNHAWGAAPANIIPRHLCGIRPLTPGFAAFEIHPQIASLEYISMRQPTIHGPVTLEISNGKTSITVPEGTKAVFQGKTFPAGSHTIRNAGI